MTISYHHPRTAAVVQWEPEVNSALVRLMVGLQKCAAAAGRCEGFTLHPVWTAIDLTGLGSLKINMQEQC